jgi:hypothetical protein
MIWHQQQCWGCLWYKLWWRNTLLRVISRGTLNQRSGLEHPELVCGGQCRLQFVVPKACLLTLLAIPLCPVVLVQSHYTFAALWLSFILRNASGLLFWLIQLLIENWSYLCKIQSLSVISVDQGNNFSNCFLYIVEYLLMDSIPMLQLHFVFSAFVTLVCLH